MNKEQKWNDVVMVNSIKEILELAVKEAPNNLAFQFLKIGTEDMEKVDAICAKYNMPIPTEMKL